MSLNLLSFPFRLAPNGSAVTQEQDSADYYSELIAVLVSTVPGERVQAPLFGVNDPTFVGVDAHELTYKIELFGPPVQITSVSTQYVRDGQQDVVVEFIPLDTQTNG